MRPEKAPDSQRSRRHILHGQVKWGRVYTKHKVTMYDIGHKTVFSGGPICVLYRRDPVGLSPRKPHLSISARIW